MDLGIFRHQIRVLLGPSTHLQAYVRHEFGEPDMDCEVGGHRGMAFLKTGHVPIVWLPRYPRTSREIGTLVHELLHALRHIFVNVIGFPLDRNTDETFCHALSYTTERVLEDLK